MNLSQSGDHSTQIRVFTVHLIRGQLFSIFLTGEVYQWIYGWIVFTMEANSMNPDQTALLRSSLIWIHIVCNIGYLSTVCVIRFISMG